MAGEKKMDLQALGDDIARTATAIDITEHKLITLLRAFDEAGGWHQAGALSCASWLSWRTGMSKGPARERMRVGRALADLPLIDEAFAAGELSYSKVRALTRIAKPDTEATLLETARAMTGNQLEKLCRNLSRGASAEREAEPERFFHMRTTDEGMVRLTIQVTADEAATLASLCRSHHRLVHEGGASIRATAAGFEFRDADGALLPAIPPRSAARPVFAENIDPWVAAATSTDPGRIDWEYATEVIGAAIGMAP